MVKLFPAQLYLAVAKDAKAMPGTGSGYRSRKSVHNCHAVPNARRVFPGKMLCILLHNPEKIYPHFASLHQGTEDQYYRISDDGAGSEVALAIRF
jgi:hypothetical protein